VHSDPKFCWRGCGVNYTDARKKKFWNAVPVGTLLRKNVQNDIPAQKYPCLYLFESM
jgi:hypothetical protein